MPKKSEPIFRVPADESKPFKYWQATVELPNPTGRQQDRRRKYIRSKHKPTVRAKLHEAREELRKRGDLPTDSITVEVWFEYWLRTYQLPELRPSAMDSLRSVVRRQIIPSLGPKTRLDKITPAMVKRLRADITDKGLSSTYARNAHHALAKSLHAATGEGRIPSNPTEYVTPPRKARTNLDVMTLPEALTLIRAIEEHPDRDRWGTSLLTAARRGEVIGLEWDRVTDVLDMSWQLQRLTKSHGCGTGPVAGRVWPCGKIFGAACPDSHLEVPADYEYRHVTGGLYLTRPKSSAGWRIIPLVSPLRETLQRRRTTEPPNEYGLVFARPDGQPRDPHQDTKDWRTLMHQVFGEDRSIRLHDIRHTTIDLLYAAGVPEDLIQEIVGHSTRAMTRAYKSRSDVRRLRDAMEQLSELLTQPTERTPEISA
ncbi:MULTISPECIES: tyrosine-type recombinase/integrase [unclassified Microbacterium]|uniref:tyrosine-type recombinase/integrase n=1 Tax=unclassified Microbacterium TaxID=2609290 RepID=UPI00386A4486